MDTVVRRGITGCYLAIILPSRFRRAREPAPLTVAGASGKLVQWVVLRDGLDVVYAGPG